MQQAASKIKRYRGKIVPSVRRVKSYHGHPRNDAEKYEVCEADVATFMPQLQSGTIEMWYNHKKTEPVGRIVNASRNPVDNALEIEYELDGSTPKGKEMISWVEKGRMHGLSLSHYLGSNRIEEASMCWVPARNGSYTYADVTDPDNVKMMRQLHYNSNSGRYERNVDPDDPIRVAASGEEEDSEESAELIILPFMTSSPLVNASVAPVVPPAEQTPPPAAAAGDQAMPDAPASALHTGGVPAPSGLGAKYDDAKLKMTYGGILTKEEKAALLGDMATSKLEAEMAKKAAADEKKRADEMEAKIKAWEAKEAKDKAEAAAKLKEEQDKINDSHKEKLGDLMQYIDDADPSKAMIQAAMVTADTETLAKFNVLATSLVKASRGNPLQIQAEDAYRKWVSQNLHPVAAPPSLSAYPPPVQAAAPAAAAHVPMQQQQPVQAAAAAGVGYDPYAPRAKPRSVMADPVRAAASRQQAFLSRKGAMAEYAGNEARNIEWAQGAGANFDSHKVCASMTPGTRDAFFDIWDNAAAGDGTRGRMDIKSADYVDKTFAPRIAHFFSHNPHLMRLSEYDDDTVVAGYIED